MLYITKYTNGKVTVKDSNSNQSKVFNITELNNNVFGLTSSVCFVYVGKVKNTSSEVVYTFDIANVNDTWRKLVPYFENDFFRVDVTINNCTVTSVNFYYIYESNEVLDITNYIDKSFILYIKNYALNLYNMHFSKTDLYNALAREYAEKYGIVNYKVIGNTLIYNVSYPAYLGNPHYTVQYQVNLDNGVSISKQLKRFDSKGLVNRH